MLKLNLETKLFKELSSQINTKSLTMTSFKKSSNSMKHALCMIKILCAIVIGVHLMEGELAVSAAECQAICSSMVEDNDLDSIEEERNKVIYGARSSSTLYSGNHSAHISTSKDASYNCSEKSPEKEYMLQETNSNKAVCFEEKNNKLNTEYEKAEDITRNKTFQDKLKEAIYMKEEKENLLKKYNNQICLLKNMEKSLKAPEEDECSIKKSPFIEDELKKTRVDIVNAMDEEIETLKEYLQEARNDYTELNNDLANDLNNLHESEDTIWSTRFMHIEVSAESFKEFLKKNKNYLNAMVEKETMMCLVRKSNAEYAKKLSRVMIYEKHAKDLVILTDAIKTAQKLYAEGVQNLRNIVCTMLDVHEKHTSLILEIYNMIKSAKVIPAINSKPQTKYENT